MSQNGTFGVGPGSTPHASQASRPFRQACRQLAAVGVELRPQGEVPRLGH
jgi:hypothetical protein